MDAGVDASADVRAALEQALAPGGVRSVFQPIIELDTGHVVAYEALARGPQGPLERPDLLFAAARAAGRLAELDEACRAAAFRGAVEQRLLAPLTVFVNVEPEVLDSAPLADLLAIAEAAPRQLRIVLEITERALAARPAELLRTVERVRELGWGLAVDDVGAEAMSLAFLPLLRPDVVKLDLRLVQERPGPVVAEIMNAVNAYAERSGAVLLAEGIEDDGHLAAARALGATLGQGWLFGRPAPVPAGHLPTAELVLPPAVDGGPVAGRSPFACLPGQATLRQAPKRLLIELSKQLEREAMRLGETCVVAATFQEARHFTAPTVQRYRDLVERTGFVCALGAGLPVEPLPGLRGASLAEDDPVRGEWDVVVLGPHFAAALLARDLGDDGPDADRTFEYGLTYDRDAVTRAAAALLSRVAPGRGDVGTSTPAAAPVVPRRPAVPAAGVLASEEQRNALQRALDATPNGVTVVDLRLPDQPLVYVNAAFAALAGLPVEQVVGRNCRFLQGPDTDPAAVAAIRSAVERGEECTVTLLNHRGPDREEWWNEVRLIPVADATGRVVQYVGMQEDVTARVAAERAQERERDRTLGYLARLDQLAATDPLTGLLRRGRLQERVTAALWEARAADDALALVVLDLDGFAEVRDRLGSAVGDALLLAVADRLRARLRRTDLIARLAANRFVVALPALSPATAETEGLRLAAELAEAVGLPVAVHGHELRPCPRTGVAVFPADGADVEALLRTAGERTGAAHPLRPR